MWYLTFFFIVVSCLQDFDKQYHFIVSVFLRESRGYLGLGSVISPRFVLSVSIYQIGNYNDGKSISRQCRFAIVEGKPNILSKTKGLDVQSCYYDKTDLSLYQVSKDMSGNISLFSSYKEIIENRLKTIHSFHVAGWYQKYKMHLPDIYIIEVNRTSCSEENKLCATVDCRGSGCFGDSGSPVFWRGHLWGVVSRGQNSGKGGITLFIHPSHILSFINRINPFEYSKSKSQSLNTKLSVILSFVLI